MVSFNRIPANLALPLFYAELDPSQAGTLRLSAPGLLIGTKTSAGTAPADIPLAVGNLAQIRAAAGAGSELFRMGKAWLENNPGQELYIAPVAEPGAGVAAAGTITVSGTITANGTLPLYIGDDRLDIAAITTDTPTTLAARIAAAITAATDLAVTASPAVGVVTVTAKWKGLTGNQLRLGVALGGAFAGEAIPAGLTVALVQPTGGTTAPALTTLVANMGDEPFEHVVTAFTDATSLATLETEFGFSDAGRWGYQRQLYGHVYGARADTYSGHTSFLSSRNAACVSLLCVEATVPTPAYEVAAAYGAQAARALLNDPARPLQTLPLLGVMAAPKEDRFAFLEQNVLATSGGAVQAVDATGLMRIQRESTTYRLNDYSQPDTAYELVTTLATLARVLRTLRQVITSKYPRHKLANNGTRSGPGQAIVTPNTLRAEFVAQYDALEYQGLVEDARNFARHLIVEREPTNPNRVNVLFPPDLVNQFRIMAVLAQFRLQYDTSGETVVA